MTKEIKNEIKQTYQQTAYSFAAYENNEYPFLALGEEAGEVLGKLAKFVRKHDVPVGYAVVSAANCPIGTHSSKLRDDLLSELGDVQWQLAACCTELGVTLEELQELNITKLTARKAKGTIVGEGDDR